MNHEVVTQSITHSDDSFDTLVSSESKDENKENSAFLLNDALDAEDGVTNQRFKRFKHDSVSSGDNSLGVSPNQAKLYEFPMSPPPSLSPPTNNQITFAIKAQVEEVDSTLRNVESIFHTFLSSPTLSSTETSPCKDDVSSSSFFGYCFDAISHATDFGEALASQSKSRMYEAEQDFTVKSIEPIVLDFHKIDSEQEITPSPKPHHIQIASKDYDKYDPLPFSNPIYVLRSCRESFRECSFLLSYVKCQSERSVQRSQGGSLYHKKLEHWLPEPQDLMTACRRVKAAIYAFGGSIEPYHFPDHQNNIFRGYQDLNHKILQQHISHNHQHPAGNQISREVHDPPRTFQTDKFTPQVSPKSLTCEEVTTPSPTISSCGSTTSSTCIDSKLKYRCKVCGQPKQNHVCPYRHSMQRSIGVTVHAAVNAYEAREPGYLAPSLSDMNNFMDRFEESTMPFASDPMYLTSSPENSHLQLSSSEASVNDIQVQEQGLNGPEPLYQGFRFVRSEPLYPEQYRSVTSACPQGSFIYQPIPLSFPERKRLSDTLFTLSMEIPAVQEEVAEILRHARLSDTWDMAVAQLLTQIVVALHCYEGDKRLDGLHDYLLNIGIAS